MEELVKELEDINVGMTLKNWDLLLEETHENGYVQGHNDGYNEGFEMGRMEWYLEARKRRQI